MKPNKTTITFFLFVLATNLFSQNLYPFLDVHGSLLCKEPLLAVTEFRNSQNFKLEKTTVALDSKNLSTNIEYIITSSPGAPSIKKDTIFDLNKYISTTAFDSKLKSALWRFKISYKIDGTLYEATPSDENIFQRCFEPNIICNAITVTEKYIRSQCEPSIHRSGQIAKHNDSLTFVFVDTSYNQTGFQFRCLEDTSKPTYVYEELVLSEKNNLSNYHHLTIKNKNVEVTLKNSTYISQKVLSESTVKSIKLDPEACITSLSEKEYLSQNEVFPNPAVDFLYVKSKPAFIQLTNAYGQTTTLSGDGTYTVEGLAQGLYILTYQMGLERKSYKVQIK